MQLESINNQSTSGLYQDFSTSLKATLYVGENYGMTINTEKYSSTDRLNVYIDRNGDKTFTSNELMPVVYTGVESKQGKGTYTIVVPATAAITTTRMRVVLYDSGSNHGVLKIYDLAGLLVMSSDYTNAGLFQLNMPTLVLPEQLLMLNLLHRC